MAMKFKQVWVWPADVEQFVKDRVAGFTVHVCCGGSDIGDVKVDKFVDKQGVIQADMCDLPLDTGIADTAICDPPWEIAYHLRSALAYELRRILKVGGQLIFIAPWIPKVPGLKLEETWVRQAPTPWANCALLTISQKVQGSMFGDR